MTTIDVDTSPLQAAREWRGIGRVAAALSSGLPMVQAEALETGDPGAFDSVDEMVAAAVVYGASLGIGRDEAMALLDRTVTRTAAVEADLPDIDEDAPAAGGFSAAVRERSARIATPSAVSAPVLLSPLEPRMPAQLDEALPAVPTEAAAPVTDPEVDLPADAPAAEPVGPSPEQAVEMSQELHLDSSYAVDDVWDDAAPDDSGELEAWVQTTGDTGTQPRAGAGTGVAARVGDVTRTGLERVLGTDRSDQVADWWADTTARTVELLRSGRERLRRSEHATLIVAIGAGAVLIAVLVAVGGALGGDEDRSSTPGSGPETKPPVNATEQPAGTPTSATDTTVEEPTTPVTPMVAPGKLKVIVLNAGSKKGYAKVVQAKAKGLGYGVGTTGNAKSPYSVATIVHPAGMEREAKVLGRNLGITALQEGSGAANELTAVVI